VSTGAAARPAAAHAHVRWLRAEEGGRASPPAGPTYSTVARFAQFAARWPEEAWSVVLTLQAPPDAAGRMTVGIRMLSEAAAAWLLSPGSVFELVEGRRCVARGEVLQEPR
jgi:hypothetical protein